jgi:hypothetical protein
MRKEKGVHSRFGIIHDETPWEHQQEIAILFAKM